MSEPAFTREPAFTARARVRRVGALIAKEGRQIVRDPSSILIALVLPLILLFLFGYGVSLDATRTRIGVVIEAPTPTTRSLAAAFAASPYFAARIATDRRAFSGAIVRDQVGGIVVIPATFEADAHRGRGGPDVQLILDGTDPNTASIVNSFTAGKFCFGSDITCHWNGSLLI